MNTINFKMIAVKITSPQITHLVREVGREHNFTWLGSEVNNGSYYYLFKCDNEHEVYNDQGDMDEYLDRLAPVYILDDNGELQYQFDMISTKRRIYIDE